MQSFKAKDRVVAISRLQRFKKKVDAISRDDGTTPLVEVDFSDLVLSASDLIELMGLLWGTIDYDFDMLDSNGWQGDHWLPVYLGVGLEVIIEWGAFYRTLSISEGDGSNP